MKRFTSLVAATLLLAPAAVLAKQHDHQHQHDTPAAKVGAPAARDALADGEIRKVDKGAGKVTIKHGPVPSIDMPPMTMVFRAKDPAMLDQVKAGDRIRFKAEKIDGVYTVTEYQKAK